VTKNDLGDSAAGGGPDASPAVSVVIPVRNGQATIERSIRSVLAQTLDDLEVIVVDDGSSDETVAVIEAIDDTRLRLLRRTASGVSTARNAGIDVSRGRYVSFLDGDDHARARWLETLVQIARRRRAAVVCAGIEWQDRDGISSVRTPERQRTGSSTLFLSGSYLVERDMLVAVGGFDETLGYSENFELGLRLQAACQEQGRQVVSTDDALVVTDRTLSGGSKPFRLAAIERVLTVHEPYFRRDRSRHATWLGVAAVEAARLGRHRQSASYALRSMRLDPRDPRAWVRLTIAAIPPLARRRWESETDPADMTRPM